MKTEKLPLISIIIDNWNGKHFLQRCLNSVFNQNYPNFEVILIDDCSLDKSADYIKDNYKKVKLIENKKHVGFAIANNQGIIASKGKYLLLLNNDTEVTKDFLFPLVELLEKNNDIGGAQSKIKVMDNFPFLDEVASYLTPNGFLYHIGFFEKDSSEYEKQRNTFSPKGACFFIKKEVLNKVGLLDDRFYCYFEESDLAWRIWLAGYKIVFEPKSIIYHYVGGSMKQQLSHKKDYFAIKNRLCSLIINLSLPFLVIMLPLHLFTLFIFVIYYLISLKYKNLLAVFGAFWWNITQLPTTIKKRIYVQNKIRKITDWQLFKKIFKIPSASYYVRLFLTYQKGR